MNTSHNVRQLLIQSAGITEGVGGRSGETR